MNIWKYLLIGLLAATPSLIMFLVWLRFNAEAKEKRQNRAEIAQAVQLQRAVNLRREDVVATAAHYARILNDACTPKYVDMKTVSGFRAGSTNLFGRDEA